MIIPIWMESGDSKPLDSSDYKRIDLTDEEIEIIKNGGTIQTQYRWLSIGKKIG